MKDKLLISFIFALCIIIFQFFHIAYLQNEINDLKKEVEARYITEWGIVKKW